MYSQVKPNVWAVFRLPSDSLKVIQVVPNTVISLGKYGSFHSNSVLGRPYNLTYELLDRQDGQSHGGLRIVPASELHADTIAEEGAAANLSSDDKIQIGRDGVEFELLGELGQVIMRSNRETIDDSARQTLTMEEIEALKRDGTDAGKDLISKLMLSHTGLDQKTAFSLAKYKLLKTKKYLRRFTILPLDVPLLTQWLIEDKDPSRIMEIREELLALAGCWGNVHFTGDAPRTSNLNISEGRWLVIDEVGGLLVAAMADRMDILHPVDDEDLSKDENPEEPVSNSQTEGCIPNRSSNDLEPEVAHTNTITLIHSNAQPNLSLLKYFSFIPDSPPPGPPHPLCTHLKTISWLQLLAPEEDTTYSTTPPSATPEQLAGWKSGKRGTYYRKHRRYARIRAVVDETRKGGFDGLLVASYMDPVGVMQACVPLLRGGAQVVVYSPTVEPLAGLADLYSMSRRTAFLNSPVDEISESSSPAGAPEVVDKLKAVVNGRDRNEDFPLNPTLLLAITVQTSKVRKWQVLPGRTHPLMTGRGGAEGYLFTAVRVIPAEGKVSARGKYGGKRRKVDVRVDDKVGKTSDAILENDIGVTSRVEATSGLSRVRQGEGVIVKTEDD